MLGRHRRRHPWLPYYRRRRRIVLRQEVGGLGLSWGDWSSLEFPGECVVVVAAVRAVGRGGWVAASNGFGISTLEAGGVLTPVR